MGASSELFIQVRMREQVYDGIDSELRNQMEIQKIDEINPSYPEDELWKTLKDKSVKSFKELKKREFELRNKK